MKITEFRNLIRKEIRNVIAENKTNSTKIEEGFFDTLMKAISEKVKLDGSILASSEAEDYIKDLDKSVKGKPETFIAFKHMAKQMGVDLMKNIEKVKEAVVYAFIESKFENWIRGSYKGIYDPKTSEFSLIPASAGANPMTDSVIRNGNSMQIALRKTIREEVKKVIKETNLNKSKIVR